MYILVLVFSLFLNSVSSKQCNATTNIDVKWIVDCSSMQLKQIPSAIAVEPILYLKLNNNSLSYLLDFSFTNWTSVVELDLSSNNISVVYYNSFNGLHDLQTLNLSTNSLKYFTSNITNSLTNLKVLDLSDNLIKVIGSGTFQPVQQLQKLFLGNNVGLGNHLSQFETLKISLNQGLALLDLANTTLEQIPDDFLFDAPHLNLLYLQNNVLIEIPLLSKSLKYLDLSRNIFQEIPEGSFEHSPNLRTLILNSLPNLKNLPAGSLKNLANLTVLSIDNCHQLKEVVPEIFSPSSPQLKKLSISHCQLTTLHHYFGQFLDSVEYLDLQGNPWICDDSLSWLTSVNIEANLSEDLRCDQPEGVRGILIKDLYNPVRESQSTSFWINFIIFICIIGICVVAVMAMIKHLSHERVENYLQLQNMGTPQVPSRNLDELLH